MSPIETTSNWFQGVPLVADAGTAALTLATIPPPAKHARSGTTGPSSRHADRRYPDYSATLGSPASAASISDCGCS